MSLPVVHSSSISAYPGQRGGGIYRGNAGIHPGIDTSPSPGTIHTHIYTKGEFRVTYPPTGVFFGRWKETRRTRRKPTWKLRIQPGTLKLWGSKTTKSHKYFSMNSDPCLSKVAPDELKSFLPSVYHIWHLINLDLGTFNGWFFILYRIAVAVFVTCGSVCAVWRDTAPFLGKMTVPRCWRWPKGSCTGTCQRSPAWANEPRISSTEFYSQTRSKNVCCIVLSDLSWSVEDENDCRFYSRQVETISVGMPELRVVSGT